MVLDPLVAATLRVSFGALFGLAGMHKIVSFRAFTLVLRNYLRGSPLEGSRSVALLGAAIIGVELALLALCALPSASLEAGIPAAVVLLGYAAAMHVNLRRGNTLLDCGCSWGTHRQPVSAALVLRNLCLAALAALIAIPAGMRPLAAIDFFSVAATSIIAASLYAGINLLLAVPTGNEAAR